MSLYKTVTIDYTEWESIKKKLANKEVIIHRNGGCYSYMYYEGENDLIQGVKREVMELANEYEQRIEHAKYVSARLTKLKNRNWFERLFNIDM